MQKKVFERNQEVKSAFVIKNPTNPDKINMIRNF